MKSLRIEENKYQLKVYCSTCKRPFSANNIDKCKHPESQKYKSIVYTDGNHVRTKIHATRNYETALIGAIQFKKEVKGENQPGTQETINTTHKVYHLSILDAANLYMDFKNGIKVPTHLKRDISKKHLESIEHNIRLFLVVLKQKGIHPNDLSISELNDYHVGMFADYLDEKYSKGSWNLRVSILKSFVEYTIKKHFLTMQNPFVGFKRIKFEKTIESISEDEFNAVLEAIKTKNPIESLNGKTKGKNRYRPYLEDAFKLALYTGLRREELLTLEWKDIVHFNFG